MVACVGCGEAALGSLGLGGWVWGMEYASRDRAQVLESRILQEPRSHLSRGSQGQGLMVTDVVGNCCTYRESAPGFNGWKGNIGCASQGLGSRA